MNRFIGVFAIMLSMCFSLAKAQVTEMEQDMFENMRKEDKAVIVAVHGGAENAETQQRLDKFNARLKQAYPQYDFREAWTSRGGVKPIATPDALFSQLHKEGYTHVLVQSSELIDGVEMQYLRYMVDTHKEKFKQMRLGAPLLNDVQDYEEVAKMAIATYGNPKEVNVLVCHGTEGSANAEYAMLEYALHDNAPTSWFVGTVDGYPSLDSLMKQLRQQKLKKVNLIPFMFATDKQAMTDKMKEWSQSLQKAGYKVATNTNSVGELDAILNIFEKHIRHAEKYRRFSAKELKMLVR